MKLVWHSPLAEREWIRVALARVATREIDDPDFTWHGDGAIHVVSGNHHPYPDLARWFAEVRARGRDLTLFQVSDEWFSGHYAAYRHFDRVLRNHGTQLAEGPGILTLPLGYPNGGGGPADVRPASRRRHSWSFAGEVKASRLAMADALRDVAGGRLVDTRGAGLRLDRAGYRDLVADTMFLPCPMGNVMLETWRFYEALELGAIPLVERRATLDYYRRLLGPHPVPTFANWRDAAGFVDRIAGDPAALDRLQHEVRGWWTARKAAMQDDVARFVAGPSHAADLARFAAHPRNRIAGLHRIAQTAELLRHQSAGSLADRARLTASRVLGRLRSRGRA